MRLRTPRLFPASFVVAALLGAPGALAEEESPAAAGEMEWDGKQVEQLSGELARAVGALREAIRKAPDPGIASGQSRARMKLLDELRGIRTDAEQLAKKVAAGAGRDETRTAFEDIDRRRRDAAENARRMFLPEPVPAKIVAARSVAAELAAYYGIAFAPAMEEPAR